MLNNIKIGPLNPSKSHIVPKKHLLCHHEVCALKWQSMCTSKSKYLHIQACATLININKGGQNKELWREEQIILYQSSSSDRRYGFPFPLAKLQIERQNLPFTFLQTDEQG